VNWGLLLTVAEVFLAAELGLLVIEGAHHGVRMPLAPPVATGVPATGEAAPRPPEGMVTAAPPAPTLVKPAAPAKPPAPPTPMMPQSLGQNN